MDKDKVDEALGVPGSSRAIIDGPWAAGVLGPEVYRLRELCRGHIERAARLEAERDRYKKALEHITSADCWNSKVTAQDALDNKWGW